METPLVIRNLRESFTVLKCGISFSAIHTRKEISSIGNHFLRHSILYNFPTDNLLRHRICHNLHQNLLCACLQQGLFNFEGHKVLSLTFNQNVMDETQVLTLQEQSCFPFQFLECVIRKTLKMDDCLCHK
jgi:hypothetical protein